MAITPTQKALRAARQLEKEPALTEKIARQTLQEARELKKMLEPEWFLKCTDGKHKTRKKKQ